MTRLDGAFHIRKKISNDTPQKTPATVANSASHNFRFINCHSNIPWRFPCQTFLRAPGFIYAL